jgi:hypothetical protein
VSLNLSKGAQLVAQISGRPGAVTTPLVLYNPHGATTCMHDERHAASAAASHTSDNRQATVTVTAVQHSALAPVVEPLHPPMPLGGEVLQLGCALH